MEQAPEWPASRVEGLVGFGDANWGLFDLLPPREYGEGFEQFKPFDLQQEQQEQRERDTATELMMDGLAGRKEGNQDEPATSATATAMTMTTTTTKAASFVPPAKPRTTT
ncbi:phosphotransferase family protein [Aspergillus luchuensis]|uniref:Phosphotransferase family protein n=1 Tax=Aspergillus kawachii TaxID=1069201 RepID=A0A146FNA2_ASPKA|nr:phosphotransferase family protein [Aspergillus luchuensis]